jgi:hypothetical protein
MGYFITAQSNLNDKPTEKGRPMIHDVGKFVEQMQQRYLECYCVPSNEERSIYCDIYIENKQPLEVVITKDDLIILLVAGAPRDVLNFTVWVRDELTNYVALVVAEDELTKTVALNPSTTIEDLKAFFDV